MSLNIPDDITRIENTPINFAQIQSIVHKKIKSNLVMRVLDKLPENCKMSDIFGGKKFCALFCDRHFHGKIVASHWVCLIKKNGKVEMFDSLGNSPLRLTHVLNSPKHGFLKWCNDLNVKYNTTRLQHKDLQDCGDWVAVRMTKWQLSNKQFVKWIRSFHIAPDKVVSLMSLTHLLDS